MVPIRGFGRLVGIPAAGLIPGVGWAVVGAMGPVIQEERKEKAIQRREPSVTGEEAQID
jgi:hypothetical protein